MSHPRNAGAIDAMCGDRRHETRIERRVRRSIGELHHETTPMRRADAGNERRATGALMRSQAVREVTPSHMLTMTTTPIPLPGRPAASSGVCDNSGLALV
jgi:hypothetical protein